MVLNYFRPANWANLGTKGSNSQNTATDSGKQEWIIFSELKEIGSTRQREANKNFGSHEEAQAFLDGQAAKFTKLLERSPNATIKQSESELLVHINGVQIVKMSYLTKPLQCA